MLHVTNGDATAMRMREAGLRGDILPWRDVLHEGPVPEGLPNRELRAVRARFLADRGLGDYEQVLSEFTARDAMLSEFLEYEEVVLWFEHDLYDQLQLLQLLAFFAERKGVDGRLMAVIVPHYLGQVAPQRLRLFFDERLPVGSDQRDLGLRAWNAFRSADPRELVALRDGDTRLLPYLAAALTRHLEEFPAIRDGLSRSERQILEVLQSGPMRLGALFRAAHHYVEDPIFLGDTIFALYVQRLTGPEGALVQRDDGVALEAVRVFEDDRDFWAQRAVITNLGKAVLSGDRDWVQIAGIDRWLGGVHLVGRAVPWRWDAAAGTLVFDAN